MTIVTKFTVEQAASVAAIQQVINEWGNELDQNDGLKMNEAGVLTEDCQYNVGGAWRKSRAEAARFYAERKPRLEAQGGAPVMRHINSNFRIAFVDADRAEVGFMLLYFAAVGTPPINVARYGAPPARTSVPFELRALEMVTASTGSPRP